MFTFLFVCFIFFTGTGSKLLPDYFLDDIDESFHGAGAGEGQSSGNDKVAQDSTEQPSMDTPESVFAVTRSLINEDVVQQVKATFLFDATGKNPGMEDLANTCITHTHAHTHIHTHTHLHTGISTDVVC